MAETKHVEGKLSVGGIGYSLGQPRMNLWSETLKGNQSGGMIACDATPANAAELVHRWNCYPELLEACKAVAGLPDKDGWVNCRANSDQFRLLFTAIEKAERRQ